MVAFKRGESDPLGKTLERDIRAFLGIKVGSVRTRKVYTIYAKIEKEELARLEKELFVDQVTERPAKELDEKFDWMVEVCYKPGVTDNVGKTATMALAEVLKREIGDDEGVSTSTQYLLSGVSRKEAQKIATGLLANSMIEDIRIMSPEEIRKAGVASERGMPAGTAEGKVNAYDLDIGDEDLIAISRKGVLSLSLDEMRAAKSYFKRAGTRRERRTKMEREFREKPTDVELEMIAQTWSEHCKHKIFNARIRYYDENGKAESIDSLFKTFILEPSMRISKGYGWVASAFHDNAGIVRFNDRILVADKIETHNAPSALDPYGGAITGILGVNRDVMGAGMGAKLTFNVFGYCFGSPFYGDALPDGVMHPRRIREGVHKGVIAGGNESGIPLAGGWEFFDDRYAFRPLVYCGTIGVMPLRINGKPSESKKAEPGDFIVMVGGRIGKDGIHGATFSSAELDKGSPVQAVQIGDSITQKKMSDFLLEARDLGLYKCITDNGAGGLSSSVGEMAKDSNGCTLDLKKAPLKYQGLAPWEILISESQERMTVAVDPSRAEKFMGLARRRGVEATVLGEFEDSGIFHATYGDRTVAYLEMEFLHGGLPQMELNARWQMRENVEPRFEQPKDMNKVMEEMLARLNVCSKEDKLRQYDHEVKALSVVKPLVGRDCDVPSDATVSFLEYGSKEGLIVAQAVNPHYSDIDTYQMVASVIDEAIRRVIAVGGRLPSRETVFYALDNFCWNLSSLDSEDGRYKLAQLVRANKALRDYCIAFGLPCISGKDSMKNVWRMTETAKGRETERIVSIPPTLLFSARAKLKDVGKAVTMDVKRPGDLVYVVGNTYDELGGSEYFSYMGEKIEGKRYIGNNVPKVDAGKAKRAYAALSEATERGIVRSMHTPTIGGLGIALAQSAFAGGYGMNIDLGRIPYSGKSRDDFVLFSQSNCRFVVTVPPEKKGEFERIMDGNVCAEVGSVTDDNRLRVEGLGGKRIIDLDINEMKSAWKNALMVS
jgi:phosphoribosylformylglycinamidine synthase